MHTYIHTYINAPQQLLQLLFVLCWLYSGKLKHLLYPDTTLRVLVMAQPWVKNNNNRPWVKNNSKRP